ncbi:hypothetical protein ACHAXR_004640, partial [Thalassiosira sp. AJA248-18]
SAAHAMKQIKSQRDDHNNEINNDNDSDHSDDDDDSSINSNESNTIKKKNKKKQRPKKQHSAKKLAQIHQEEIAAFRRRMGIRLSVDNKHEIALGSMPDPITSFKDWKCPTWWCGNNNKKNEEATTKLSSFHRIHHTILSNIENGKWLEPTPIQMQALPSLMERRDIMGCAPTGSGKTGAFVLPMVMLAKCGEDIYYGNTNNGHDGNNAASGGGEKKQQGNKKQKKKANNQTTTTTTATNLQGHIRSILIAPSRELASQLHRETLRLSTNMPGKFHSTILSKSNAGLATSNQLGGKFGLDCLVATPLRLVECLERGMKLQGVRLIVLDEADRLLDASDGSSVGDKKKWKKKGGKDDDSDNNNNDDDEEEQQVGPKQSGSSQSRTFLQQIDSILTNLPPTATRALFSATLGPSVRHLSESILRSPIDITTGIHANTGGNSAAGGVASEHIQQELQFVGREEGKLLAIRQLVAHGITPPILIFLQSKDRAQALYNELLYDGIHVDVIHAGHSPSKREISVTKFRRGETWVLICTDLVARGVDFKAVNLVINYDLPCEGVTYVHRIGRTGRAGRAGKAITFFTEGDFDNLRTIANVMRLSGCVVPEWMLTMKKKRGGDQQLAPRKREGIDTTPRYDRKHNKNKRKRNNNKGGGGSGGVKKDE